MASAEAVRTLGAGQRALILAAERLFAERGIAGVSLREINLAANQKNVSAAHYHFGSRDGLVSAVLEHRLPALDRRRGEMLQRSGGAKDLRFYLKAFVDPLVEEMRPRAEGNFYVRFMQQYERYRGSYEVVERMTPASVRIYAEIEALIFYFPPAVRAMRLRYLINMIHSVLATAEERIERGEVAFADLPLTTANMVDAVCAALTAPLSWETIALLDAAAERSEALGGKAEAADGRTIKSNDLSDVGGDRQGNARANQPSGRRRSRGNGP